MNSNIINRDTPTIIVTGIGAIIGQGIIKSLKLCDQELKIIGVDKNADAFSQDWCDKFIKKPDCLEESEEYFNFWKNLLNKEKVDLIFPGIELDVLYFSNYIHLFEPLGIKIVLNSKKLINLAQNKWVFGQYLEKISYPNIPTIISHNWEESIAKLGKPPFIFKPIDGSGSKDIVRIDNKNDFTYWSQKFKDDFIVQKYVGTDEDEYTVGTFGFGDGSILEPIIFKRKLSSEGSTKYAEVVEQKLIKNAVKLISEKVNPVGPTNFQFRMECDIPYLLEINPRFSSSNSLRSYFGYNEACMSISYYLYGERPKEPKVKSGKAWRYQEDYYVV